jgi:hypothetical protein
MRGSPCIGRFSWYVPSMAATDSVFSRGVAQSGRALRSGRRSRRFKSCLPDQLNQAFSLIFRLFYHGRTARIRQAAIADSSAIASSAVPNLSQKCEDERAGQSHRLTVRAAHPYHSWYSAVLRVHNDATADLLEIRTKDSEAFQRLLVFIEQLRADSKLPDKLLDHGYGRDLKGELSVKKWQTLYGKTPVWRLRALALERSGINYRLIYLYDWHDRSFNILAIVSKSDIDYDDVKHPLTARIIARVRAEFAGV